MKIGIYECGRKWVILMGVSEAGSLWKYMKIARSQFFSLRWITSETPCKIPACVRPCNSPLGWAGNVVPGVWALQFGPIARVFVTESPVAHTGTYFHAACLNCMFCWLMIVGGVYLYYPIYPYIYIHIYIYPYIYISIWLSRYKSILSI